VIVRPQHPWSLVGVDRHDAGSNVPQNGSLFRHCRHSVVDLTLREVIDSLDMRDPLDCNEWVMRDYDVLGVLVQPPFSVRGFGQCASWKEIATAFRAERLFTIQWNSRYPSSPDTVLSLGIRTALTSTGCILLGSDSQESHRSAN
jgi:hypothetical protein